MYAICKVLLKRYYESRTTSRPWKYDAELAEEGLFTCYQVTSLLPRLVDSCKQLRTTDFCFWVSFKEIFLVAMISAKRKDVRRGQNND